MQGDIWFIWVIIGGVILYLLHLLCRGIRRGMAEADSEVADADGQPLSQVGRRTPEGVLVCPYCGSAQLETKRSAGGKVGGGCLGWCLVGPVGLLGALLAPKSRVRCVACGREFERGRAN